MKGIYPNLKQLLFLLMTAFSVSVYADDIEEYQWPDDQQVVGKLRQWQDLKYGIILHWGVYSVPGMVESWQITSEDWITPDTTRTYEEEKLWYWGLSKDFNPVKFNPEQWAKVAKDGGMKYVVFTTKHHDGFCLWDTKTTDYSVAHSGFAQNPKVDVARYVFDAVRQRGFVGWSIFLEAGLAFPILLVACKGNAYTSS